MIIVQTPLRISFIGGGTDFEDFYKINGGAVLSSAINKNVYVIIKKRFDDLICINYTKRERVEKVDDIEHDLVREAMKLTGVQEGVEITTLADVPADGTGLGSSSSITVALLHALYTYRGESVTQETLAEQACLIELEKLKKPIGRQDQYIAAYGNLRFINFNGHGIKLETVNITSEKKRLLNSYLMLFYTGISRKADEVLYEQKENIERNNTLLSGLKSLVYEAKIILQEGSLDEFGEIMHRGWMLKRTLANKISNSQIDQLYKTARDAGAIGGKITGAGGGGFFLVCCPPEKQISVKNALHLRELPFHLQSDGSKVIFNYRNED